MNKFYWAIFSRNTMLAFTIRTTKKQCLSDYVNHSRRENKNLLHHECVKKIYISDQKPVSELDKRLKGDGEAQS